MDLRWLEDVLVLLEEGNLSRAARRRAVTQPAFSRRIRAFEHWLGEDVLERDTNRVRIRASLRDNEDEIRALLLRLGELQRRIRVSDPAGRMVTLTTQHALALAPTSHLLVAFRHEFGPLRFRLRTADRSECISIFVRGDADLLMCHMSADDPNLMFDRSFTRETLGRDALVPVASPALTRKGIGPDLPFIAYPDHSYFGQVLGRAQQAGQVQLSHGRPLCDTEFSMSARALALRGLGLAWLPMGLVRDDILAGSLQDLSAVLGTAGLDIVLFVRPKLWLEEEKLKRLAATLHDTPDFERAPDRP